jgi:hypothetical protein
MKIEIYVFILSTDLLLKMPSFVWNYFSKQGSDKARCNEKGCNKVISYLKGTNGMIYHLKTVHTITDQPDSTKRPASEEENNAKKKQKTLHDFYQKTTLEEDVAKMICKSNLSFNQIATCEFIRKSLAEKYPGRIIPKKSDGIAGLMMKYYEFAENETKMRIRQMKDDGKKFSATLDEWTSSAFSRYLDINIHLHSLT